MNPNAAQKGKSFKGVVAYITHDEGHAKTSDRVLFTDTFNLRTDNPEKAARVMAYTAQHAADLKKAAGVKATGRKSSDPVYHFSLSWIPGEQPTQAEMIEAGRQALDVLGFGEHEAVFAAHGDKDHIHLHIVVNRVHPVTGKTHNKNFDFNNLHAWGHEYDKARGMEHHSPERAAKYEKDPVKREEYKRRAEALRVEKGVSQESSPRPEWEAKKGATHPKSRAYQEIKATYAEKVRQLSQESRETTTRHHSQWEAIKARQQSERAALWQKQQAGFEGRRAFNRASGARVCPVYSFRQHQTDRAALRVSQREEVKVLKALLKARQAPEVSAFLRTQRQARARFMAANKERLAHLTRNLSATQNTPLHAQGAGHRDHLAKFFNEVAGKDWRTRQFMAQQIREKVAFFERMAEQQRPSLDALEAQHRDAAAALTAKLQAARDEARAQQAAKVERYQAADRKARADLSARHGDERRTLKDQQEAERRALQGQWSDLNEARSTAWGRYRAHRSDQEQGGHTQAESGKQARHGFTRSADPGRSSPRSVDPGRSQSSSSSGSGRGRNFNRS